MCVCVCGCTCVHENVFVCVCVCVCVYFFLRCKMDICTCMYNLCSFIKGVKSSDLLLVIYMQE